MTTIQSGALDRAGARIVHTLGGVWRQGGGMCRCPAHDDHLPSLSIRVGSQSLLFKCFAGCAGVEVLRAVRRLRLDVPVDAQAGAELRTSTASGSLRRAKAIWDDAEPLEGTIGALYMRWRAIDHVPPILRFNLRTPLGSGRGVRFRPAVIAPVTDDSGLVSIQRLFLERHGRGLASDLLKARFTLGRPLRGAVRLFPPSDCLGLAEGVETALSAAMLLEIPVWASLGSERLAHVAIPDSIRRLVLLPDNDAGGRIGELMARRAFQRPGRTIVTQWPWFGLNDWNDVLMRQRCVTV